MLEGKKVTATKTETLARYVSSARYDDFPQEAIRKAMDCLQDGIGCALGAAQTDIGRNHISLAGELGGTGPCSVIGGVARTSPGSAAQANTDLTNLLDFDDMHWLTLSHPGCAIISAALAVAQMRALDSKEFLTAVLVGYEAGLRVGRAIRSVVVRHDGKQEVVSNPSYIVFAATAAACRALRLDEVQTAHAFGLSGSTPVNRGQSRVHFGGINAHPYTDNKYDMGVYGLLGVANAIKAQKLRAPSGVFDSDRWWSRCGANAWNETELTAGLTQEFRILDMAFKPMCCGAVAGTPVTAVRQALRGRRLGPGEIREIVLIGIPRLECYEWENMIEAEFATPSAVAMEVAGELPGPGWFVSGRFRDPDIMAIASKIRFVEDPRARALALERGQWPCSVEICLTDGSVLRGSAEFENGAPESPFSAEEALRKFLLNSEGLLGRSRAQDLNDVLLSLDRHALEEMTALLVPG